MTDHDAQDLADDADLAANEEAYRIRAKLYRLHDLAKAQGDAFEDLLQADVMELLHWPFAPLDMMVGPIRPGTLHIVGARPGNGKTTLLMNSLETWAKTGKRILYCGMEMSPAELRLQWAAWACGYDHVKVLNKQWYDLPPDARDKLRAHRDYQVTQLATNVIMPDSPRISLAELALWIKDVHHLGVDAVVVDHLHRMNWGGRDRRQEIAEGIVVIKELAKQYEIPIICAAQLNRHERDPLGPYIPPPLEALKESGDIEQEADVVLMGYRALLDGVKEGDLRLARQGMLPIRGLVDDRVMAVRCVKHRLSGEDVLDADAKMYIHKGRLYDDRLSRDVAAGRLQARIDAGLTPPPPMYSEGGVIEWTLREVEGA